MAFLCKWILPKLHRELLLLLYAICKIPKAIKSPKFKIATICQKTICSVSISPMKTEFCHVLILYKLQSAHESPFKVCEWKTFISYLFCIRGPWKLLSPVFSILSQLQVTSLSFSNFHLEFEFFVDFNLFSMFALSLLWAPTPTMVSISRICKYILFSIQKGFYSQNVETQ